MVNSIPGMGMQNPMMGQGGGMPGQAGGMPGGGGFDVVSYLSETFMKLDATASATPPGAPGSLTALFQQAMTGMPGGGMPGGGMPGGGMPGQAGGMPSPTAPGGMMA